MENCSDGKWSSLRPDMTVYTVAQRCLFSPMSVLCWCSGSHQCTTMSHITPPPPPCWHQTMTSISVCRLVQPLSCSLSWYSNPGSHYGKRLNFLMDFFSIAPKPHWCASLPTLIWVVDVPVWMRLTGTALACSGSIRSSLLWAHS